MRLGSRIFLLTSGLIALAVGAAVAVTWQLSSKIAHQEIQARLDAGAEMQAVQAADSYDRLQLLADVFVADAALIAYVAEASDRGETASILDLLLERQEDLGYAFAVVTDPYGVVLARTDRLDAAGSDLSEQPLVAAALVDFRAAGVWQEGGHLYQAVAIPLAQGGIDLLGFFATAYPIDDVTAEDTKRLTGSEVSYFAYSDGKLTSVGSTLDDGPTAALTAELERRPEIVSRVAGGEQVRGVEVQISGEPWLLHLSPLLDPSGQPVGLTATASSLRAALAPYRRIGLALALSGLLAVLVAFALTYPLAARTTRPIRSLVAATAAARDGRYDTPLALGRTDEVGELASAFHSLLGELREKREMEAYVAELSRNMPDQSPGRELAAPRRRTVPLTLLAIELRRHVSVGGTSDPVEVLESFEAEIRSLLRSTRKAGGELMALSGHQALASFEGDGRTLRAVRAAVTIHHRLVDLRSSVVLAIGSGPVVTGSTTVLGKGQAAVLGRPVHLVESLLREAVPGEILIDATSARDLGLDNALTEHGIELTERSGLATAVHYFSIDAERCGHLVSETGSTLGTGAAPTLSGLSPGIMVAERFEILSRLGAGGMGVVYKARDRELNDVVALKMLRPQAWQDSDSVERLKKELKLARMITHPNVLRVYDLGLADGAPFISMEYVHGVTLRQLLDQQSQRIPFTAALRLSRQICQGLAAVHAAGVIHRDMKPENVILEPAGNARLMDFGIARPQRSEGRNLTMAGSILGTPRYLAPEQLEGKPIDQRADIYATGVVLYEIFTGSMPHRAGRTLAESLRISLDETPDPPSKHWPEVPTALAALLLRCLEKSPDRRFQTIEELIQALEAVGRGPLTPASA